MSAITAILIACVVLAFLFLFWWQVVVIRRIVRPFEREDDLGLWPFRLPGRAKRERFRAFLREPEHRVLRRRWLWSWAATMGTFLALVAWLAISGGPALP